jgi:hypothetical protein
MTDEVLKLALDALEGFIPYLPLKDEAQCNRYDKAIKALRLAIDVQNMASKSTYKKQLETKDDPVAWEQFHEHMAGPNYVAPQRTWVGLKDDDEIPWDGVDAKSFAKAIEARLKEKNT